MARFDHLLILRFILIELSRIELQHKKFIVDQQSIGVQIVLRNVR